MHPLYLNLYELNVVSCNLRVNINTNTVICDLSGIFISLPLHQNSTMASVTIPLSAFITLKCQKFKRRCNLLNIQSWLISFDSVDSRLTSSKRTEEPNHVTY